MHGMQLKATLRWKFVALMFVLEKEKDDTSVILLQKLLHKEQIKSKVRRSKEINREEN